MSSRRTVGLGDGDPPFLQPSSSTEGLTLSGGCSGRPSEHNVMGKPQLATTHNLLQLETPIRTGSVQGTLFRHSSAAREYVQWCYEARRKANTFRVIRQTSPRFQRAAPVKSRAQGRERRHNAKWRQGAAGHAGGRPSCSLSRLSFATTKRPGWIQFVIAKVAAPEPERRDQIFSGTLGAGASSF